MNLTSLDAYLEKLRSSDVILYGAGSKGKQALELLRRYGVEPVAICDSDEGKWGEKFNGLEIENYDVVKSRLNRQVIVLLSVCSSFVREIHDSLRTRGGGRS